MCAIDNLRSLTIVPDWQPGSPDSVRCICRTRHSQRSAACLCAPPYRGHPRTRALCSTRGIDVLVSWRRDRAFLVAEKNMDAQQVGNCAGLPHEGEPVEFVLEGRDVAMNGTYVAQTFRSRWSG